jgi:hypothetical protein
MNMLSPHISARTKAARWRWLAALAVAGSAVATMTTTAGAAPGDQPPDVPKALPAQPIPMSDPVPGGFASWSDLLATQRHLDDAADAIAAAAEQANGFGSVVVDPENREVRVYWKGHIPAPVQQAVAAADSVVRVLPAAFSKRELDAEAQRLMHLPRASQVAPSAAITAIAPLPDASGLRVSVDGSVDAARHVRAVATAAVPVTIQPGVAPHQTFGRSNDSPPYWGGAVWKKSMNGIGICSTGFAITHGGQTTMLSAGHCAWNGDGVWDGGGDPMGWVQNVRAFRDILEIASGNNWFAGRIYNGTPGVNEFSNPVTGASTNHVGDYICTSGAFSGTRCNIKITEVDEAVYLAGNWYGLQVEAEQQADTNAAGQGDSGGPVFRVNADPTTVSARGTITGGDGGTVVPCTGDTSGGRICTWRIYYADIASALQSYSAQVVTGI